MIIELIALTELNKHPKPLPQPKPVQTVQVAPKPISTHVEHGIKKEKKHIVKRGETLTTIAKKNKTSWQRIFYKNKSIKNPDDIKPGQRIVIPSKLERLKKRAIRQVEPKQAKETIKNSSNKASTGTNGYDPGNCTWHVKNLAPWVGSWGDASSWSYNASRDGYTTHPTPVAGAVAWRSGHVAYVIKVTNGGVLISEMNYDYVPFHQRKIVVSVSSYQYIY